ncbi:MAG: protein phosphatase 2C domain-containing protein [Muribaculaceae bacterium]|nr:protein phosphatase 2C domain-containing protein [Muribaculaceae bacterium]
MIKIRKPLCFTEIGRKDNQEDYLFPVQADADSRVFILCDGMGGHDNGEVASMTAGSTLGKFLTSCTNVDMPTFEAGLEKAYDALDGIDTGSAKKPGTTMTCLCLNEESYLVAHIGDSRIYHIRPSLFNPETKRGGILYQSSDHSLVNDLLKAGEIDEEEARNFPQKNVITRAMQPHLKKRYKADIYMFDDIMGGDYFFLCSDGILEQLSNEQLCEILASEKLIDEEKIAKIKSVCDGNTRDNYTCWLIPVDKVTLGSKTVTTQAIRADVEEEDKVEPSEGVLSQQPVLPSPKRSVRMVRRIELIFDIIMICLTVWLAFSFFTSSKDESQDKKQVKERVKESKQDNFVAPVKPIVEKKTPNLPASEK